MDEAREPSATPRPAGETARSDTTSSSTSDAGLYRVGVRIPPFWPEKPALWFAQIEGQFMLSNITNDATKFYYVIAQLDHEYATEVEDVITNPPANNKYENLKTILIKRLSASQEKKIKQLLMHEELGDRKPSQFLRHLQHLAGPAVPKDFIKTIWSSRLPHSIQQVIATQGDIAPETLADLADKVHEIAPAAQVASTSAAADPALVAMANQVTELAKQVAALTTEVRDKSNFNRRAPRHNRHRSHSRPRSRSGSRHNNICWYHNRFGTKSYKCTPPCQFKPGSENCKGGQ